MPKSLRACDCCPSDPLATISASPKGIEPGMNTAGKRWREMQETSTSTRTQISLLRGQSYYAQLRRGTVISATVGTVSMTSRLWLEHAMLTVQTPVHRGGVYCVPSSGWFEIAAQSDAELLLVSPRSPLPMASWATRFFRLFTAKPQKQAPGTTAR